MDVQLAHPAPPAHSGWQRWSILAIDRVHLSRRLLVALFVAASVIYVGLELLMIHRSGRPESAAREQIALAVVAVFVVLQLRLGKAASLVALEQLRPVVLVDDAAYDVFARRMLCARPLVELLLLALTVGLFGVAFVAPADQLAAFKRNSPLDWAALVAMGAYLIAAVWLGLSLIYATIRNAVVLTSLSRTALAVSTFDIEPLLPFGRLALTHSLASVFPVLIPLAILGPPRNAGFAVIGASLVSLAFLVVPLAGVHQAITDARRRLLLTINQELMQIQQRLPGAAGGDLAQLAALYQRVEMLAGLRKQLLAGPSWPFRDNGTVVRVLVAVLSPGVLTLMQLLVQQFVFPMIKR